MAWARRKRLESIPISDDPKGLIQQAFQPFNRYAGANCSLNDLKIESAAERLVETRSIMKQYVIDELRPEDHHKIKKYLDQKYGPPDMGSIYWLPLAAAVLTETQQQHTDCQPFYVAIDLQEGQLALELLVRTKRRVRCACIGYAAGDQRIWMMDRVDAIFKRLDIMT